LKRLNGREAKALFVLSVIVSVGFLFPFSRRVVGAETSQAIGENSLPLDVYIVSLPDVGNYRATNHSMVVEGALEAAKTDSFCVFLDFGIIVHVNVSITVHIVSDWEAYRMLIEWGNNAIAINTHDEYLPIPSDYTKEEWVDKIAGFMLNRWGTWTHLGGYPLYRVWYQNGTKEEWGEQGFQKLTRHIGRENTTCYPPSEWQPEEPNVATYLADFLIGWYLYDYPLSTFAQANAGYPIKNDDFRENFRSIIYGLGSHSTGAIIYFSPNRTTFNYGAYVHSSAWRFFNAGGQVFTELNDLAMGFVSTVAAIWVDVGDATFQIYSTSTDSPRGRIKVAQSTGRTLGLERAEELLQKAIDAFNMHNYKMAVACAKQAQVAAENATQPNPLPQIIAGTTLVAVIIGVGAYYKIHNKKKNHMKL